MNYHLANLLLKIEKLYKYYNNYIFKNRLQEKYNLKPLKMFKIEGIEKIRKIVEKNKKRKANQIDKLPNNTIVEINGKDAEIMLDKYYDIQEIMINEGIEFSKGKGSKKSELEKIAAKFINFSRKLYEYKNKLETMEENRNSYSKTDKDATFMRMKDDHMRNGQLKASYNLQFIVENYFIISSYISNDRTDYNTLIPVIKKLEKAKIIPKSITADSGYCSEKNLKFLYESKIAPFIKLQEHEKQKTRKYKNDISKHYNMKERLDLSTNESYYICADGRKLNFINKENRNSKGFHQVYETYACSDCSGCNKKSKCLYKFK